MWKDRRSVGRCDEREGKAWTSIILIYRGPWVRGGEYHAHRLTHRSDRHTDKDRESWGNVALLLIIAARMKPDDDGQTEHYRLADFTSGYPLFKSISGCPDIG